MSDIIFRIEYVQTVYVVGPNGSGHDYSQMRGDYRAEFRDEFGPNMIISAPRSDSPVQPEDDCDCNFPVQQVVMPDLPVLPVPGPHITPYVPPPSLIPVPLVIVPDPVVPDTSQVPEPWMAPILLVIFLAWALFRKRLG